MFRKALISIIIAAFGSACVTQPPQPDARIESIDASLAELNATLDERYIAQCSAVESVYKERLQTAEKRASQLKRKLAKRSDSCVAQPKLATAEDKLVLGEIERVYLVKEQLDFTARIDTGAETSSIGAYQITPFERDGKEWVRFKLSNKKSAQEHEYRVSGRARIKRGSRQNDDLRLEIKIDIELGGIEYRRQVFNLADRSYLDHQVLIGRSFLTDLAVVDTASKFLLKK